MNAFDLKAYHEYYYFGYKSQDKANMSQVPSSGTFTYCVYYKTQAVYVFCLNVEEAKFYTFRILKCSC